jgi:threonine aldolase
LTNVIDLRSDTVTHPTARMREAMARAELGDDSYRDDPTVNRLQEVAADLLGKEDALFVPSGTMGNLISLMTWSQGRRGAELIVGDQAHILHSESGGYASLAGLAVRTVPNGWACPAPADIEMAIRPKSPVGLFSALIAVENTQNRCGGTVISVEQTRAVAEVAKRHGIPCHLDGARIWNAAVAQGVPARELVAPVDSLSFCFSKGLSCPIGSMVVGTKAFIDDARRNRKLVGGAMRQVGVLAAAGLVALDEMIDRLAEDHANARLLAERLAGLPGIGLNLDTVETNIIRFNYTGPRPDDLVARLRADGLWVTGTVAEGLRCVTHYGIGESDVRRAAEIFESVIADLAGRSAVAVAAR